MSKIIEETKIGGLAIFIYFSRVKKKQIMKKSLLLIIFAVLMSSISRAQVSGSALLCPGFVYTYTANISGAVSYTWTTPVGWQIISGQGTSQIEVMCNVNEGDICADGYDGGGIFIAQNCFTASWGGDGDGWDAIKNSIGSCICSPYSITTQTNGGSSPCGGCGSGTLSANAVFAVYDSLLPGGSFLGLADNVTPYYPNATTVVTLYVYLVDTTFGLANAVPITGGTCATTINNTVQLFPCTPPTIIANVTPSPTCLGDTFTIKENSGLGTFPSYQWTCSDTNLTFTSANGVDSIQGTYSGTVGGSPVVNFMATDIFGCFYSGQINVDIINCIAPPVAAFSVDIDSLCPNTCANFTNLSTDATSSQWIFSGAIVDTSSFNDPVAVCYNSPGAHDVKLIVSNAGGTDTLLLTNYIFVFNPASPQNITLIDDTLYSTQGFSTYQWYYNGSLIAGANQYYYPATLNGNYSVLSTDANGCESTFEIQNIILSNLSIENSGFTVFPNPASSEFIVDPGAVNSSRMDILNSIGRVISSQLLTSGKNKISTSDIAPGIYFIRVTVGESSHIQKIMIIN